MSKPTKSTDLPDGSAGIIAAGTALKPTTDPGIRTITMSVRNYTLSESKAEEAAQKEEAWARYRATDVLTRLKTRIEAGRHWYPDTKKQNQDDMDAAAEIEWLRAAKPEAVRRGDLVEMVDQLRTMQATIAALLAQLETAVEPLSAPEPNP